MFNIERLTKDLEKNLSLLLSRQVVNDVSKSLVNTPQVKLGIYLTTSGMKAHLLGKEVIKLVNENRFFPAVATLRMLLEETVLMVFILSKMEKKKDWEEAQYLLTKVNIGRRTRDSKEIPEDKRPYNVTRALQESEKYLVKKDKKMHGVLDETYTAISDFVHPNAPSRYFFWEEAGDKIKFVYRKKVGDQDLGMILNYACMVLKLYNHSWSKLNDIKLKKAQVF